MPESILCIDKTEHFWFLKFWFILKTDLVECRSMFGTNYISLREVIRLGIRNSQNKLFTENAYLKK
jgi:hypothetical protein